LALRILVTLIIVLFSGTLSSQEQQFVIGVGDKIVINVYNESDLTVRARVDKLGAVNFPLLGVVIVSDKTPKQLAKELEERYLDGYLVEPLVTVLVEEYRPFYIRGEVRLPGVYEYSLELTVDQAIAVAGGLKDRASRSKWFIIRGKEKQKTKVTRDTKVLPGDIVTVEASLF